MHTAATPFRRELFLALAEAKRLDKDFADWETRSDSWVKTEGQKYGLRLLEPGEGEQQEQPREGAPPADRQKGQTPAPPDK